MQKIQKPAEGEYAPYAITYIDLVPQDGLVIKHLQDNMKSTPEFIRSFQPEKRTQPWMEGEWTIQEILVHILDTERIFCYRALRFARNDGTPLAGFEQADYVLFRRKSAGDRDDPRRIRGCPPGHADFLRQLG